MENLVLIQKADLDRLIKEAASNATEQRTLDHKNVMSLDEAVVYLRNNGCPISKSSIYKHTMRGTIPFTRFGERKLVFKTGELDNWVEKQMSRKQSTTAENVRKAALKKN